MKKEEINKRVSYVISSTKQFMIDRCKLWTEEISNAPSGANVYNTYTKRGCTRPVFFDATGAGGMLYNATLGEDYYMNSCFGSAELVVEHPHSPQLFGEYALDVFKGFHTEKNESIIEEDDTFLENLLRMCLKTIYLPKSFNGRSMNVILSNHTCINKNSTSLGGKHLSLTQVSKYKYLNENADYSPASDLLMGNLTITKGDRSATQKEIDWLLESSPAFDQWQIDKYGAYHYKSDEPLIISPTASTTASLELFL
jgi:hypothetical protein